MGHQGTHCVIIKRDGWGHPMISGVWFPTKRMYIFSPPLKEGMPRIVLQSIGIVESNKFTSNL